MFPVLFAMGRLPGWIAHWKEMMESPKTKIGRPRQIYTGPTERPYVPLDQRGLADSEFGVVVVDRRGRVLSTLP